MLFVGVMTTLSAIDPTPDLNTIGPLQNLGSDTQSIQFQNQLPSINTYISNNTIAGFSGGNLFIANPAANVAVLMDPSNFQLATDANVRAYFLPQSTSPNQPLASNADTFGFSASGTLSPGQQAIIFNTGPTNTADASKNNGPTSGQFVDLGSLSAGTIMNFFMVSATDTDTQTFWNDSANNTVDQGFSHVQAVQFLDSPANSPFYLLAWEDSPFATGDGNFDDLFAVIQLEIAAPEPSTYLILTCLLAIACLAHRQKKTFTG